MRNRSDLIMLKKIVSLLLVFSLSLGVVGCSNNSPAKKKSETKSEEKSNKKDKDDDKEVLDYNYTFIPTDYPLPEFEFDSFIHLNDFKNHKFVLDNRYKETSKAYIDYANEYLDAYSYVEKTSYKKINDKVDSVIVVMYYEDRYKKAKEKSNDVGLDDYRVEYNWKLSDLDKNMLKILKNHSVGDNVSLKYKNEKVKMRIYNFGKYFRYNINNIDDDFAINTLGFKSLKDFKNTVKKSVHQVYLSNRLNELYNALFMCCKVDDIPKDILDHYVTLDLYNLESDLANTFKYSDINDYFKSENKSLEDYVAKLRSDYRESLKLDLLCEYIREKYKIKIKDSDISDYRALLDDKDDRLAFNYNEELCKMKVVTFVVGNWCLNNLNITYKNEK